MQFLRALFFAALVAAASAVDPVSKVLQLLGQLQTKIGADGAAEQKAFEEYVDFCENGAKDKEFEITTAKSSIEGLSATIGKAVADGAAAVESIDELSADISGNEADLTSATEIREKENQDFTAAEKELVDTIDTLARATNMLERKLHGAALLEAKVDTADVSKIISTLSALVEAASFTLHDKQKLLALAQDASSEDSDDDELGAPAPEAYKSHSASIIDVLEDLHQKAEVQLQDLRREEVSAQHTFDLTKQSLEDQVKVDTGALADTKAAKAEAAQTKAQAEGELGVTEQTLSKAQDTLKNLKSGCMRVANDHGASVTSREEELKAISEAIAALQEMTGGAVAATYSFLQTDTSSLGAIRATSRMGSGLRSGNDLVNFEVVNMVRNLARQQKSAALAQLAGRISSAVRLASSQGQDPFAKVKEMISGMIEQLVKEAGQEAAHKAYCDEQYAETKTKTDELKYDITKMSTKIDKATAESARLKDEVVELQKSLADVAKAQAEATALRGKEHEVYVTTKADLEQGLDGVRLALKVLREYYATTPSLFQQQQPEMPASHERASGSGTSVIGMLEVVESDLGKNLANIEMEEETAAVEYEKVSMDNKMSTAMMQKDVKYKSKEAASLDKSVTEMSSDLTGYQTELDAVLEYSTNIRNMCEVKPETHEERVGRREAEISGLKEALKALDGQALQLLQRRQRHRKTGLRGVSMAP